MEMTDAEHDWYLHHVVFAEELRESPWETRWRLAREEMRGLGPLGELAVKQGFVVTPAQARMAGVDRAELRRQLRSGQWHSPHRGTICPRPLSADEAPAMAATGAALMRPGAVISHRSAAVLYGLPVFTSPRWTGIPELTEPQNSYGHSIRRAHIRSARVDSSQATAWFGAPVTTVARMITDLAREDRRAGLVCADAALSKNLITASEIGWAVDRAFGLPGVGQARAVLVHADAKAESPLESVARLLIIDHGLPVPELQRWILDPVTDTKTRVDMLWREQRVIGEVDGAVKYRVDSRWSERSLWDEKRRQERLEQLGFRVVRLLWHEIRDDPLGTAARVRWALTNPLSRPGDGR
jgi:hypothetical protein